jgi:3-methyladenine DNA glycosylase AlkD
MDIFTVLQNAADAKKAVPMAAYMRDQFEYLGLPKPLRESLTKDFLREKRKEPDVDWDFVFACYAKPQREFTYLALDYLIMVQGRLTAQDMQEIETLIVTHPWWDSVDTLDEIAGQIFLKYPQTVNTIRRWMTEDNMWLRRVSINFQQKFKDKTDIGLLSEAIEQNLGSSEFFINKAIGWSLREYAKTNRAWVEAFVASHTLSALSLREATKHFK